MALTDKLTAIADAIRAKTGGTGTLTLDQMATTISTIETDSTNFKIVGGTTQPTSPSENTIWINTSTAIKEYQFSATQPTTRADGTVLQNGDVWIKIIDDSTVSFNAVKKNNLQVSPSFAHQWNGSNWIYKEMKCYQSGKWKTASYKILDGPTFYNGHGLGALSKAGDYIFEKITTGYKMFAGDPNTSYCYQMIAGNIDVTNYKTIKAKVKANSSYTVTNQYCQGIALYAYVGSADPATSMVKSAVSGNTYDLTIDVSSITGNIELQMRANGYGNGTFELIELT